MRASSAILFRTSILVVLGLRQIALLCGLVGNRRSRVLQICLSVYGGCLASTALCATTATEHLNVEPPRNVMTVQRVTTVNRVTSATSTYYARSWFGKDQRFHYGETSGVVFAVWLRGLDVTSKDVTIWSSGDDPALGADALAERSLRARSEYVVSPVQLTDLYYNMVLNPKPKFTPTIVQRDDYTTAVIFYPNADKGLEDYRATLVFKGNFLSNYTLEGLPKPSQASPNFICKAITRRPFLAEYPMIPSFEAAINNLRASPSIERQISVESITPLSPDFDFTGLIQEKTVGLQMGRWPSHDERKKIVPQSWSATHLLMAVGLLVVCTVYASPFFRRARNGVHKK